MWVVCYFFSPYVGFLFIWEHFYLCGGLFLYVRAFSSMWGPFCFFFVLMWRSCSITVFLDLSKPFDTLNFDILLSKLRYYGVSGVALDLIKSYLTGRKQYVIFRETKSNFTNTTTGIPQGSILGPLLFSIYIYIYINDLITVSEKFNFLMYAEDTTLYFNVENFTQNEFET